MNQVTNERIIDLIETVKKEGLMPSFIREAAKGYAYRFGGNRAKIIEDTEMRLNYAIEQYDLESQYGVGVSRDVGEILADILMTAEFGQEHEKTDANINYVVDTALSLIPGGGTVKTAKKVLSAVLDEANLENAAARGGATGRIAGYGRDGVIGLKDFLNRRDPRLKWGTAITGIAGAMGYAYGFSPSAMYNSLFTYGDGDKHKDHADGDPNADKAVDGEYEKETNEGLKAALNPLYKRVLKAEFNKTRNYEDELNQLLKSNVSLTNDQVESYVVRELKRKYVQIREERSFNPNLYSPTIDFTPSRMNRYNSIVY